MTVTFESTEQREYAPGSNETAGRINAAVMTYRDAMEPYVPKAETLRLFRLSITREGGYKLLSMGEITKPPVGQNRNPGRFPPKSDLSGLALIEAAIEGQPIPEKMLWEEGLLSWAERSRPGPEAARQMSRNVAHFLAARKGLVLGPSDLPF